MCVSDGPCGPQRASTDIVRHALGRQNLVEGPPPLHRARHPQGVECDSDPSRLVGVACRSVPGQRTSCVVLLSPHEADVLAQSLAAPPPRVVMGLEEREEICGVLLSAAPPPRPIPQHARPRARELSQASRSAPRYGAASSCRRAIAGCRVRHRRPPRRPPACSRRRRSIERAKRRCSFGESRSRDHSIVARRVWWRASASRPPRSRSRRRERRSRICPGDSTAVRAAASSTARGRLSSRWQSEAIVLSASSWARAQKSSTASCSASGGTVYSTSPSMRSSSLLVTSRQRLAQARSRGDSSGAAVNDLLEVVEQEQELALADMRSELLLGAERLCHRLKRRGRDLEERRDRPRKRRFGIRGRASPADSSASRVLPAPPGPDSVTNLAPFRSSETTSATSRPLPMKELAGRGRFVFEIVFSGGKRTCPSW